MADAGLIENIIINLVDNAVHAVSKKDNPRISITTGNKESSIELVIEDNGCGIPPEHMPHIFEPSFTLKGSADETNSYASGIKGSGYGLTNTRKFIEKHGGAISVESVFGEMTRVVVSLPVISAELRDCDLRRIENSNPVKEKRILVVEDEFHFGRILNSVLRRFDHKVDLAVDGKTALNKLGRKGMTQ